MQDKIRIENENEYEAALREIDVLMKKGEKNLTECEAKKLRWVAEAVENFEDKHIFGDALK